MPADYNHRVRDGCWSRSGRTIALGSTATPVTRHFGPGRAAYRPLPALLLALLLALSATVSSAPRAGADTNADVSIELTRLSPSVVKPDSTIVFQGRVTNVSNRPLVRLQATIWRSLAPLTTRAQLQQVDNSPPTDPEGQRMYSADTPDAYQDLYTDQHPNLAPGQSKTFTVRAKATDFFYPTTPTTAVYLAGIQVRENGVSTVGRARTLLPVAVGRPDAGGLLPGQASIGSTTLVELTSPPSMTRNGVFTDDQLAAEIAPGGRLDALLTAAEQNGASYAIDPDLITELRSMRSGYKVVDADGRTTPGRGSSYAGSWLARFRSMQADHDGFQLLYANTDLSSLVHAGRLDIVTRGERAAATVPETRNLPLLAAPADGAADQVTLQAAGQLHARAVLLADTTVDGLGPLVRVPGSPPVLSYDTAATAGGPGPDPRDTEVQVRQASLADSFLDSISGQPSSSLGRLRVVTKAGQAGGESAALSAPWLKARTASDLLGNTPQDLRRAPNYPPSEARLELKHKQLDRISDLERRLTTYQHLAAHPDGLADLTDQAVARAASQDWRGHRHALSDFIRAQQLLLRDTSGKVLPLSQLSAGRVVRVESNPQVTLTGSSAAVPVTIINDLDIPIRVQLLAESPNRSRLRLENIPASKLGIIAAGSKVPAQVPTRVDANGTLIVTFQLATTNGDPVGQEHVIRLNATQAGMIGWIIAIASGIVLLSTVVLRIRQVARERGDAPAEDDESGAEEHPVDDTVGNPVGSPADNTSGNTVDNTDRNTSDNSGNTDENTVEQTGPGARAEDQEDTVIRPRPSTLSTDGRPRG